MRERSKVLVGLGELGEAFRDLERVAQITRSPGDYYTTSELALQAGEYSAARRYADLCVNASREAGSTWYVPSASLLGAMASYQADDDETCRLYLQSVDDDAEILWLVGFDRITKQMLIEAIERGSSE